MAKDEFLRLRVTKLLKEKLEAEAISMDLTLSEYLRYIIAKREIPALTKTE